VHSFVNCPGECQRGVCVSICTFVRCCVCVLNSRDVLQRVQHSAAGAGTYEAEKTVFKQTESHLAGETNVEHDLKIFFTCVCVSVRASVCGVYTQTHTLFNRSLTW
jgi:hypothetical protein